MADFFEKTVEICHMPKKVSNWLMGETMRLLKEKEMDPEEIRFSPEHLAQLIQLTEQKVITGVVAKELFEVMFEEDVDPARYMEKKGLRTVNDQETLRRTVLEVIDANPKSVADYRGGKERAIGFLVGQTMKAMKNQADPTSVTELLKELIASENQ